MRICQHRDAQPRIGGGIDGVPRSDAGLHGVKSRTGQARTVLRDSRVRRREHRRIEDRGVDALGDPGPCAVIQRLDHADRRQEPVAGVAHRREAPEWSATIGATTVLVLRAGERVARLIVGRAVGPRPVLEPARMAIDDAGVHGPHGFLVDAETPSRTRADVHVYDVGLLYEPMKRRHAVRALEVDADAALPSVGAHGDVRAVPPGVAPRVDLDDRGTEVGEDLGPEGTGDREAEIEHDDAGQGVFRRNG